MKTWHELSEGEIFQLLKTSHHGLTGDEVSSRLKQYGYNELVEKRKASLFLKFVEQFKSLLVLILLVAVILSLALGEYVDATVIGAIVLLNAILGIVQESRAEKALSALKRIAAPQTQVLREGVVKEVPTRELVPGDILLLAAGSKVPADARIIKSFNLQAEEAALTGESLPIEKNEMPMEGNIIAIAERKNMLFMGTTITYGRGEAVVVETGMSTEIGRIASMLEETKKESTPLQKNLDFVGKVLAFLVSGICVVVFLLGFLRGIPALTMLLLSISLAVAAIPEGLPAVVTIVLALGTQRMAQRGAIIRRLTAVETLGSTSVICSDKTGTLTLNEMMVEKIFTFQGTYDISGKGYQPEGQILLDDRLVEHLPPTLETLLRAASLNTDAVIQKENGQWRVHGDPTEGALVTLAAKAGIWKEKLAEKHPRVAEVPFTSERKMMSSVYEVEGKNVVFSKGAPEVVLRSCNRYQGEGKQHPLMENDRSLLEEKYRSFAREGLRVLAIAYGEEIEHQEEWEQNLVFLGLVAMRDPARPEAREAIAVCRRAGIRPVMITGDHLFTATSIGTHLALLSHEREAITGEEMHDLPADELRKIVPQISVYARVSPEEKVKILTSYQETDNVVAMTGDGVNDAPALKKADIGVAMGITGTDVSKEAADMILTDDNFATIVKAVGEGRTIFSNIRKFLSFLLSCNLAEVIAVFSGFLLFPASGAILTAPQILWMNLVTDGFPALALGVEPKEPDVMDHPPRPKKKGIFTQALYTRIAVSALLMAAGTLLSFYFGMSQSLEHAETMAFTTIVVLELFFGFFSRSEKKPVWKLGFFTNRYLVWACLLSLGLQLMLVYTPFLQGVFNTTPLGLFDWGLIVTIVLVSLSVLEALKVVWFSKIRES